MSVSQATKPTGMMGGEMAQSNALADRDEAFNTRLGSMRGWQMAIGGRPFQNLHGWVIVPTSERGGIVAGVKQHLNGNSLMLLPGVAKLAQLLRQALRHCSIQATQITFAPPAACDAEQTGISAWLAVLNWEEGVL